MRSVRILIAVLGAVGWLAEGCATRAPDPAEGLKPRYSGIVTRVRPAERYVLIECGWTPPPGTELVLTRGGILTGRARATARRRGCFVTAEILEGDPAIGDAMSAAGGTEDKR